MKKNNDDGLFWVLITLILTILVVMCCNSVSAQEEKENETPNECVAEDPHETEKIEEALVEQGYFSDLIPGFPDYTFFVAKVNTSSNKVEPAIIDFTDTTQD